MIVSNFPVKAFNSRFHFRVLDCQTYNPCESGALFCENVASSSFHCICQKGWKGENCEERESGEIYLCFKFPHFLAVKITIFNYFSWKLQKNVSLRIFMWTKKKLHKELSWTGCHYIYMIPQYIYKRKTSPCQSFVRFFLFLCLSACLSSLVTKYKDIKCVAKMVFMCFCWHNNVQDTSWSTIEYKINSTPKGFSLHIRIGEG